jgi:hypothetical protein
MRVFKKPAPRERKPRPANPDANKCSIQISEYATSMEMHVRTWVEHIAHATTQQQEAREGEAEPANKPHGLDGGEAQLLFEDRYSRV